MTPDKAPPVSKPSLQRVLGLWSAIAIVIGTVIGSGIFLVPTSMIKNLGSVQMLFVVWIVAGLLSLFGALTYAELAAAMPEAGGEYVYLSAAYGPFWGFSLWLDSILGGKERFHRDPRRRFLYLPVGLRAGPRRACGYHPPSYWPRRQPA